MTCSVSGTFVLPNGTAAISKTIRIRRLPAAIVAQEGSVVVPDEVTLQTNGSGQVTASLLPGAYTAHVGTRWAYLNVPDEDTSTWDACIGGATAPTADTFPAAQVSMSGGGTLQDYAGFPTRAAFVAWAAGKTPAVGTIIDAAGYSYRYIGSGTDISDLPAWVPNGEPRPEHWGAVGDGVTNDGPDLTPWAAYATAPFYQTAATINHPDTRQPLEVAISGAGSPLYRMRGLSHTSLKGRLKGTSGTGFTLLVEPGASGFTGFRLADMDIESAGFSVLFKDISLLNGIMRNISVTGLNIHGGADTADVGVSFDGNTENAVVIGNLVSDLQRNDSAPRKAHAFAVAGLAGGGGPTADSMNIALVANAVLDVDGNVFHIEDDSPGFVTVANVAKIFHRGVEIVNDAVPHLQAHIANSFSGWTANAIYMAGAGSSRMIVYAFNLMDGTGSTADVAHVRLNQRATRDIVYIANMHYNLTGDAVETTAENGVVIDLNTFDTVTGAAIVGKATITDGRGVLIGNYNSFRDVGSVLNKANSANIMGASVTAPVLVISNLDTEEMLLHAERKGYLTKVTLVHDDTPLSGQVNATFAIVKRDPAGAETTLFDNSIRHAALANEKDEWGPENVQITTHTWDAGDVILARCIKGGAPNSRSASVQIEYFSYFG